MTTNPPPNPNHGPPPAGAPAAKKKPGCFLIGCLSLVVVTVVVGIIVGVVVATSGGDGAPTAGEKKEQVATLGTPVTSGDLEFTLTGFKCGVTVKDATGEVKPQGQFCEMTVSVKNVGKKEAMLSSDDIKLKDADDVEYSSTTETMFTDEAFVFEAINPGNTVKGKVYFDIPKDVEPIVATVSSGLFGEPVDVTLSAKDEG